jgi:hypothetical protein
MMYPNLYAGLSRFWKRNLGLLSASTTLTPQTGNSIQIDIALEMKTISPSPLLHPSKTHFLLPL